LPPGAQTAPAAPSMSAGRAAAARPQNVSATARSDQPNRAPEISTIDYVGLCSIAAPKSVY
jgi:hypothetical protein